MNRKLLIVCRLNLSSLVLTILYFSLIPCLDSIAAEGFYARVTSDNINVRSDATINSQIICTVRESDTVEVILERYDWYKIKLPRIAPAFVKKELIVCIDSKTAKAVKDSINVRLLPSESSAVIGKINKNEVVNILEDQGEWYRIEPTDSCFGWIHKRFVEKSVDEFIPETQEADGLLSQEKKNNPSPFVPTNEVMSGRVGEDRREGILLEGIIYPYGKVFKRIATHKLVTKDQGIFLLKSNPANLNTLTYHRVKISGKILSTQKQKYPVIEVVKMEVLNCAR